MNREFEEASRLIKDALNNINRIHKSGRYSESCLDDEILKLIKARTHIGCGVLMDKMDKMADLANQEKYIVDELKKLSEYYHSRDRENGKAWFSVNDLTERYSIGKTTIYRLIKEGKFPNGKNIPGDRSVRWNIDYLIEWEKSR